MKIGCKCENKAGDRPGNYDLEKHPRLFFTQSSLDDLRSASGTTHSEIWNGIKKAADYYCTDAIPSMGNEQTGMRLMALAFAYLISKDSNYLNRAREYFSEMAGWTYFESGGLRDLPFHHNLLGYAVAFDWLYNSLDSNELDIFKSALIHRADESYEAATSPYNSAWNNWWSKSFLQNHWSTNTSALGMAALALENESKEAETWLNYAISRIQTDSSILSGIGDGTWHEGIYYQSYKFSMSMPFYYNLVFHGKLENIIPDDYLDNYALWRIYNYLPGTNRYVFNFGDIYPAWAWNGHTPYASLRLAAANTNNGYAEWMAQHILSTYSRNSYTAPYDVFEFFYYDPDVEAIAPTLLPKEKVFSDLGLAIWRTGWTESDLVFGIKSGSYGGNYAASLAIPGLPPFDESGSRAHTGHDHPDAGTFYLFKGPDVLAAEKTHYQEVIGSDYHNVVIVDEKELYKPIGGNIIYEDTDGKISNIIVTDDYNFLIADTTNLYRDRNSDWDGSPGPRYLTENTRYVLFIKPDFFIVIDNLKSDTSHSYKWLCHLNEDASIAQEGSWIKSQAGSNILGINVLSPDPFTFGQGVSSHPHPADNESIPYVSITPVSNTNDIRFITILFPATPTNWANKPLFTLTENTASAVTISADFGTAVTAYTINYGVTVSIDITEF